MSAAVRKYSIARRLIRFTLSESKIRPVIYNVGKAHLSGFAQSKVRNSNFPIIATSIGAGVLVGAGYSFNKFTEEKKLPEISNLSELEHPFLKQKPDVQISRQYVNPSDGSRLKLTLFQYPTCPFCCKVRAFLDYYGISYDVVEVDPVLRQQTKWTSYRKVPILLVQTKDGYQQLNDSTMIISALTSYLHNKDPSVKDTVRYYPIIEYDDADGKHQSEIMNRYFLMYKENVPKGKKDSVIVEERQWRRWADDVLVHMLSPNVYRTVDESLQAFKWFSEVGEWDRLFPSWERNLIVYAGAYAMYGIGKRLKKRHQLKDDVRESLYDECKKWMRLIRSKGTTFLGGDNPNLADLAVYGVLSSIEGCNAFKDVLSNTGISAWYFPMKDAVTNHKGNLDLL